MEGTLYEKLLAIKHERLDSSIVISTIKEFMCDFDNYGFHYENINIRFSRLLNTIGVNVREDIDGYITNSNLVVCFRIATHKNTEYFVRSYSKNTSTGNASIFDINQRLEDKIMENYDYEGIVSSSNLCCEIGLNPYNYSLTFQSLLPINVKSARR